MATSGVGGPRAGQHEWRAVLSLQKVLLDTGLQGSALHSTLCLVTPSPVMPALVIWQVVSAQYHEVPISLSPDSFIINLCLWHVFHSFFVKKKNKKKPKCKHSCNHSTWIPFCIGKFFRCELVFNSYIMFYWMCACQRTCSLLGQFSHIQYF